MMYIPGAERSLTLFASPDAPPACASPRSECRGVLDVLGTLRSSRGERLTAVPPCARSGSPKAEPGDPHAAASMRAPRWRLSVLAKAMRGVRWLFFFRAAGVALAWLAGTPWEPSRAGRRIFSRAFRTFHSARSFTHGNLNPNNHKKRTTQRRVEVLRYPPVI